MKADAHTESSARKLLDEFAYAVARRDVRGVMALYAPDPESVHIGTGGDELCNGPYQLRALLQRMFDQAERLAIGFGELSVSSAGPVSWLATEATVYASVGGVEMTFTGRITAVLERRGDRWYIVQSHLSLPAARQEAGQSFPQGYPEDFAEAA